MASRSHRAPTAGHGRGAHHAGHHLAVAHVIQGQRQIDSARTREIQSALIQRNYLTGEATGEWTPETEAAMQKFQADNGWQTKLMPDSRALIKLGLGPNSIAGAGQGADSYSANLPAAEAGTLASVHSLQN
jgi:peptidoglycan hydrolase-like protein with peptidoglycan-binding domain